MKKTVEFLESLPPFGEDQVMPALWQDICDAASTFASADFADLLAQGQETSKEKILPNTVVHSRCFADPHMHLGHTIICPDDAYNQKTNQPSLSELRETPGPGFIPSGLELTAGLLRRVPLPQYGPEMVRLSSIPLALDLNGACEIEAFRHIYDDYRGIVRKFLEMAPIDFFMSAVIPAVDSVRSEMPIAKLDAVLHLDLEDVDDSAFSLEYVWYPNNDYEEGVRAFRTLAVLFTCIQKAAAAPRSKKDHLLHYWYGIQDRASTYPRSRKCPGPAGHAPERLPDEDMELRAAELAVEWQRKRRQLAGTQTLGPEILPNARTGEIARDLKHAGLSLSFSADNRKLSADIFVHGSQWGAHTLPFYIQSDRVPFDLCRPYPPLSAMEQAGFVRLSHVLQAIYANTEAPADVFRVLNPLGPLLSGRGATSLQRNCFELVNPVLAELGYAAVNMSAASGYVRVRLAWVYESHRDARPMEHYLTCGTLRMVFNADETLDSVEWLPITCGDMLHPLRDRITAVVKNPVDVLSTAGLQMATDRFAWHAGIRENPRRAAHGRRVTFVSEHAHLWSDRNALATALIEAGLYSESTVRSEVKYACSSLVEEAREQEGQRGPWATPL